MKKIENKQGLQEEDGVAKTAKKGAMATDKSIEFPIVGIGASAGGLEAMEVFF